MISKILTIPILSYTSVTNAIKDKIPILSINSIPIQYDSWLLLQYLRTILSLELCLNYTGPMLIPDALEKALYSNSYFFICEVC